VGFQGFQQLWALYECGSVFMCNSIIRLSGYVGCGGVE